MRSVWSKHSSKYLPLCIAEQINTKRFGTTWGRVNTDRIFIFGWTNPLKTCFCFYNLFVRYKKICLPMLSVENSWDLKTQGLPVVTERPLLWNQFNNAPLKYTSTVNENSPLSTKINPRSMLLILAFVMLWITAQFRAEISYVQRTVEFRRTMSSLFLFF